MPPDYNYPVIIGAAQFTNRPSGTGDAVEPVEMMARVARAAAEDAGAPGLLTALDSVQVVNMLGWSYPNAPGMLAERIGASPAHTVYSPIGGDTPQRLINEAAGAIAEGRTRIALITGAEALESLRMARRTQQRLPWPVRGSPQRIDGEVRPGFSESEAKHGCTLPIQFYPLFENAIRAHLGLSIGDHQRRLGKLCAGMSAVASGNPCARFPVSRTAEEIATVTPKNRMVCFPYPKLMNAIIEVDQAAAVIVTGSQTAREIGVPEDRWVYLHGCGEAFERWFVSERRDFHSSPAIRVATQRALGMAGTGVDDIAMFDLYSCFPSSVQLTLDALGVRVDDPRGVTVTGGLPYFGGPGNNYVTHAVATMVQRLREAPDDYGLVTGLGWFSTKHSAGVYSARRPSGPWQRTDPKADQVAIDVMESHPFTAEAEGPATIETYTVVFGPSGDPDRAIVVGRLDGSGARFFANTEPDADVLRAMCREEFVGRRGQVSHDAAAGKNVFCP